MSMAIASDVDETSTGSSGNPVENEDTNMLADSSSTNQLDCTVHHYYEKLKDFAFDMPGGWTDATISLFINTFKQYKDDFSRSHPDDLKIWQKIVKRCVERSNNHKVFTVNSVMELAGSLKSHVLRNEFRKDDETFKLLYNDVVDIIGYFPNTTCDSVSQNLRLRSRSTAQESNSFSGNNDATPSKTVNLDELILKHCDEMNIGAEKYCSNMSWNKISKKIFDSHRIRTDIKKHLGDMKRKLSKELKGETDQEKKKTVFLETVGPYLPYFDLMPPRTIKVEDFIKVNEVGNSSSSDNLANTDELESHDTTSSSDSQKIVKKEKFKTGRIPDSFPKIKKILPNEDHRDSSESDETAKRLRISPKKPPPPARLPSYDTSSDTFKSPDKLAIEPASIKETNRKQLSPKKRVSMAALPSNAARPGSAVKTRKILMSSNGDSSLSRVKALKRHITGTSENPPASPQKIVVLPHFSKSMKIADNKKMVVRINKTDQSSIIKAQAKVELSPLKVLNPAELNKKSKEKTAKISEITNRINVPIERRTKKVNFESSKADPRKSNTLDTIETISGSADVDHQSDSKVTTPGSYGSFEKVKSNIVSPISIKVSDQVRQESSSSSALASNSESSSFPRGDSAKKAVSNTVVQDFSRLERMDENTVRIIEGYKKKVKDGDLSVMQLIPKQHSHMIQPVSASNNTSSDTDYDIQTLSLGKPPGWFDAFLKDYKKHEVWKVHQLLKMQQELVDMENRKLNVLEKILTSLNDRNH